MKTVVCSWQLFIEIDRVIDKYSKDKGFIYVLVVSELNFEPEKEFIINGKFSYLDTDYWSAKGEECFGHKLIQNNSELKKIMISAE